jgi:hypothetical protein
MRATCASLVLVALAACGCWELRPAAPNKAPAQATGPALPLRPAPVVTAEQVTEENARQKSEALRAEMEAAQRDLPKENVAEGTKTAKPSR